MPALLPFPALQIAYILFQQTVPYVLGAVLLYGVVVTGAALRCRDR